MCLIAKINNKELMAFYLPVPDSTDRIGRVELRDENFVAVDLATDTEKVMVLDEDDSKDWRPISIPDLTRLARRKMHESLVGLRELHHTT